jgi:hypothetical protein
MRAVQAAPLKKALSILLTVVASGFPCSSAAFSQKAAKAPQEATKTAPHAYQLQFENKWARVIRVHYGPRETIAPHAHTKWPAAYVYLNDGGPVIFRHKDWEHPELTRPATKAGSFRLSPTTAVNEVHEVENPNDIPSDFLRVEFKTQPVGRDSLRGRFSRDVYPTDENLNLVQFENQQIRVTRLICIPHKTLTIATSSSEPALFIVLSVAQRKFDGRDNGSKQLLSLGQSIWLLPHQQKTFQNLGETPFELLRFDLRTAPVAPKSRRAKAVRK